MNLLNSATKGCNLFAIGELLTNLDAYPNLFKPITMWQPLSTNYKVTTGDTVRFSETNSFVDNETVYRVVKTDAHYFEIAPSSTGQARAKNCWNRIVRYFDLGHSLRLEIWSS